MNKRNLTLSVILISLLLLLLVLGIAFGSVKYSFSQVLQALFNPKNAAIGANKLYIIRNLRLPRVLTAIFAGAILSASGIVFQSVFKNPMADSYVLGVSSGASFAVGLFLLTGASALFTLPPIAFLGAVGTSVLIFAFSKGKPFTLLLTGMTLNFLFSALTTLLVYLGHRQLDSILFWTMGSLSSADWTTTLILFSVCLLFLLFLLSQNKKLDLLLLDDSTAISSGIEIRKTRLFLLSVSALSTSVVVAFCGVIGFVGLMSPHIVRMIIGPKHKYLLPLGMLSGSVVMLSSDLLARLVMAPSELPIGLVTSILGAPVLLILLSRRKSWL